MHFDAAHCLRGYNGKCERLHGHRFEVEAVVTAEKLNATGIAFDFVDLKRLLKAVCDELDHNHLNDLPAFAEMNPSSEGLACYIYRRIAAEVKEPARLQSVGAAAKSLGASSPGQPCVPPGSGLSSSQ
jgi:6-pyruvoyltetrahydropterin/6-carboxytetrahydropterin synthase